MIRSEMDFWRKQLLRSSGNMENVREIVSWLHVRKNMLNIALVDS